MRLFLAFVVLVVLGWSSGASAASYSFKGLGDLPGGGFSSAASDISADGSVVVGSNEQGAARWTEGGGAVGLGVPFGQALDVSADGSVVVGITNRAGW